MARSVGVAVLGLATLLFHSASAAVQVASVVFRHGHRNILIPYEFDPYSNASYWPGGIAQISNRGKMQMYQFGQRLRERYSDLLGDKYDPEEVLVRSSSTSRCVSSALCVLAGLFPPIGDEVWNPALPWQPVPLYAAEEGHDKLIRMDASCPAYWQEFKRQMNSPEIRAFNSNYSDVYRIISEHWKPVHDFEVPNNLHDHFKIEEEAGLPLPEWTRDIYPDKLLEISNQYHVFRTYSPILKRLKIGPIMKDIVRHTRGRGEKRKLHLYAGHDDTITGLLAVMGLPHRFKMQYGAALFFELHDDRYVKVFYMANTDVGDIQRILPAGCGESCDLDTFANLMAPVMPDDWDQECQLRRDDDTASPAS